MRSSSRRCALLRRPRDARTILAHVANGDRTHTAFPEGNLDFLFLDFWRFRSSGREDQQPSPGSTCNRFVGRPAEDLPAPLFQWMITLSGLDSLKMAHRAHPSTR